MTRPIPPTLDEARAAALRIFGRRYRHRPADPDIWMLPPAESLHEIAQYVHKYRRVQADTLKADVIDALIIRAYIRAERDHDEMATIDLGRSLGLSWNQISVPLRISGQGAQQRRLRHTGPELGVPKDEKPVRAERAAIARQRSVQTVAASDLHELIARAVAALKEAERRGDLPDEYFEELAAVDYYLDPASTSGPGIIVVTRDLLGSLAGRPAPTGCGALLTELEAALSARGA